MTTAAPILEVKNLEKVYDNGVQALKGISIQLKPGEFLGVIGLSGSGKSTFLRCLNRLIEPSRGQIKFKGEDVLSLRGNDLRHYRQKIGMIFQHFNLIKRKSVLANVLSGKLATHPTWKSVMEIYSEEDIAKALNFLKVVGLEEKAHIRADDLSGGQQQRVAIARSLMQDPEILLADEPVASLDPATSHSIMKFLEQANKEFKKTIVCNLHFLSLVRQYTTRVVALKGGQIVFEGLPTDIDEAWFRRIYGDEAASVEIH